MSEKMYWNVAIIECRVVVVSGGLSCDFDSMEQTRSIRRPTDVEPPSLAPGSR